MERNEIKIGDRIIHTKDFGFGTIIGIRNDIDYAIIKFDNPKYGTKTIDFSFLNKINEPKKSLNKGDNVKHSKYGNGVIIEVKTKMLSIVSFFSGDIEEVNNNDLEKIEISYFENDEESDDSIISSFKVIPSNYSEQSCYSRGTKKLFAFLKKEYADGGVVTITTYNKENSEFGVLIVPKKGVIVFKLFEDILPIQLLQNQMINMVVNPEFENLRNYYFDKFLNSKNLCIYLDEKYKILKYPIKFVYIYQNIDLHNFSKEEIEKIQLDNKNIYFKNFTSLKDTDLFFFDEKYYEGFVEINSNDYGSIIERVVPENATLVNIKPKSEKVKSIVKNNSPEFIPITGEEREFNALSLDDFQIKMINDTKPGHYLTLANPGTGKSVLLLSKAYRIQSIEKDNYVLITCYNNNLAQHHNIFSEISGLKSSNLKIKTFNKLILDLLKKEDDSFFNIHDFKENYDEDFELAVSRIEELLSCNALRTKLNAIFIDEVQLFKPSWIDLCYRLLDKDEDKNYYFEMYGDINQDVKNQRSKGEASWQKTKLLPSLQGRVKKLDQNYRNTDKIASYLTALITEFNQFLNKHNVHVDSESSCLTSETRRKGELKVKIFISPNDDVQKPLKIIRQLVNDRHVDYNDIAIIYPAKGYGRYYKPIYHLYSCLDQNGIPFSFISGDKRRKLFDCDGIIFTTIDSSLGLDFKYVILYGLHYFDFKDDKGSKIDSKSILFNKNDALRFSETGKKIYSACSRARDGLFIIDDLDSSSPIKDIIRPTGGRKYYDEY